MCGVLGCGVFSGYYGDGVAGGAQGCCYGGAEIAGCLDGGLLVRFGFRFGFGFGFGFDFDFDFLC